MLRRLSLKDFVIVISLDVEFAGGFSVLTGETGAGKSILIDALQLALGSRGDAGVVREGAARADISAEFDVPASLADWLDEAGFDAGGKSTADMGLLLRRSIDAQGKSRAWINGNSATIAQLREAADHLVDIHGQHAWQSLTRPASVRALLDGYAGVDAGPMAAAWSRWKTAADTLATALTRQADLQREHERLAWQVGEVDKLAPGDGEWQTLDAEHQKLSHLQALIDAARGALDAIAEADDNAESCVSHALDALQQVQSFDAGLADVIDVLHGAQAQLQDAAHSLSGYLNKAELEPERLQVLDDRMSAWMSLARRYRRPPAELPALLAQWKAELKALDDASDTEALQRALAEAQRSFDAEAQHVSALRGAAAPRLAAAVTQALQQLGMAGGRLDVVLTRQTAPQSFGLESAEFLVAGHEGSTPRPLAKVASGGELSRIALAISITTSASAPSPKTDAMDATPAAATLIFDEIDAGVGGAVAETVGRLMKQLGRDRQVLAVTHLPQVAACADQHFVVSKLTLAGATRSDVQAVAGEARVAEVARMLGGQRLSGTSLAHAQEMLGVGAQTAMAPSSARRT